MIGRCNGILIVPMCLWILLWLNKQNRLSLIERFIIRVICTTRLFLMLWSFRCSLVKIFWGLYSLEFARGWSEQIETRHVCVHEDLSALLLSESPPHTIMKKKLMWRKLLIISTMQSFNWRFWVIHEHTHHSLSPFSKSSLSPFSRCMYRKQLNQQNICTERICIFIFFLICFIYHLRLGARLFRGWQLLKAPLE